MVVTKRRSAPLSVQILDLQAPEQAEQAQSSETRPISYANTLPRRASTLSISNHSLEVTGTSTSVTRHNRCAARKAKAAMKAVLDESSDVEINETKETEENGLELVPTLNSDDDFQPVKSIPPRRKVQASLKRTFSEAEIVVEIPTEETSFLKVATRNFKSSIESNLKRIKCATGSEEDWDPMVGSSKSASTTPASSKRDISWTPSRFTSSTVDTPATSIFSEDASALHESESIFGGSDLSEDSREEDDLLKRKNVLIKGKGKAKEVNNNFDIDFSCEHDKVEEEQQSQQRQEDDDSDESDSSQNFTATYYPRTSRRINFLNHRLNWFERVNMRLIHHHPRLKTVWDELDKQPLLIPEPIEQPADLKLKLLPFQKEGVGWMLKQEKLAEFNGGILADEMGMGKTIQMIALLLNEPRKKPNLVIAPTVAILQWKSEIEAHTDSLLSVYVYHGSNRTEDPEELQKYDVVLTTYSIVESAFRKQEYGWKRKTELVKEPSLLHKIKWYRIVLDEAHSIKDRACNTARAVFLLESERKWALSGTPLQNRVGELYSLIRFMQADPFAYYYCKKCPCKSISWKFSDKKSCDECGHNPMDHVCWWNNEILKPIQKYGASGAGMEAFQKLRKLLDRIMLRRTKIERADDLGLPPRTVVIRRDYFNEEEEDINESLYSDAKRKFNTYVDAGTVLHNYASIFELLMKMRQSANHPDLVLRKFKEDGKNDNLVCAICSEFPEEPIISGCKHIFCRECASQYISGIVSEQEDTLPDCPVCFAKLSIDLSGPVYEFPSAGSNNNGDAATRNYNPQFAKTSIVNRIDMENWRSSTKIEALVEELAKLRRDDSTIKSIVFSQFVNFLDLVNWRLKRAGFECVKLDGSMSPTQRATAIKYFMSNPSATIFLISLKAGGVALNLTEASQVFICDPWWNPSTELQAMDRIHRLGQRRSVKITRLIIENSIESRIVELQEKKTALVESTIGKDMNALAKLNEDDLKFLFCL